MDKLGPMREIIAQQNDDLEDWDLEELMEDMRNTQWETHFKMNAIVIIKMRATASDIKDTERKIAITTMQNYIYLLWKWRSFKQHVHSGVRHSFKARYLEKEGHMFQLHVSMKFSITLQVKAMLQMRTETSHLDLRINPIIRRPAAYGKQKQSEDDEAGC